MASRAPQRCLCSPTSHPGSFRCSLHRKMRKGSKWSFDTSTGTGMGAGTGDGDSRNGYGGSKDQRVYLAKRVLLWHQIRPSSHDASRRRDFQARPTRFCLTSSR
ncbi:hypothetical protein AMTR_s00033p00172620 [Amborella trichopoda]|uniref:Uncharacterized protein n=1 Tax=Amborella trichopoda TaxID=13333 RepID=U5D1P1_AMBTC|nr:hypothetical protein AMTR_s00033p00172620 [Amborella trichopoda]